MFVRLILLFMLLPLVELMLLVWIAGHTGLLFTLTLVITTGALGASLARHQGLQCWSEFQQRLARGELPADPLLDGLMILVAAALLVTPGVITDAIGFLLLTPPVRRLVRQHLARQLRTRIVVGSRSDTTGAGSTGDDVIDVESCSPGDGWEPDGRPSP